MGNIKGELSLGILDFDNLIDDKMIYVDKTLFIKQLMGHDKTYYFLSCPRIFGKSIFISTLEYFFKGRKGLFKNTYIHDCNWRDIHLQLDFH
ncbi:MAG: AAA family ATPase [Methanobrevibacter sp.]|jgi:hypothetical protein|nr:AAA family ATPase [Methanobrevibacter sp.]